MLGDGITRMDDSISRQTAIDALNEYFARIRKLKRRGLTKGEKAISLDAVGAIKTLPSAQPEQSWIPCNERLPDGRLNKSYLVQDKDGRRAVGTYTNWGWMFGHYMNDPVAWMPLPEPYTERRSE